MSILGLTLDLPTIFQGLVVGIPYGLLAVGLVLVYKVSRFINFAQGALGAFGGALVGSLVVVYGVPYWAAFAVGVLFAAGVAAGTEAAIVRRLSGQPLLMGVVVTLLLAQLLLGLSFAINTDAAIGTVYPKPAGFPSFSVGTFVIVPSYTALLVMGPIVVLAIVLLLRRTRFGLAVRAAAANPDAAWSAGVSPDRIAGRAWGIAGAVAAFSAILLWPTQGVDALGTLGPSLMLRGLVAAAIARFESIGAAFAAGIGIGVLDVVLRSSAATQGLANLVLTGIALVVLLARPPKVSRESSDSGDWTRLSLRPVERAYDHLWISRHFGTTMGVATIIFLATVVPLYFLTASSAGTMTYVFSVGIVGLSVLVLTGKAGQLSLGQFAIAGVGAVVSAKVVASTQVFVLGPLAAMVVGALVCLILGLPALRSKGLVLAITTLAFALATRSWILPQKWAMGEGLSTDRPAFGAFQIDSSIRYYFFALAVMGLAAAATRWLVMGRLGRDLSALRDNEGAARALGVPATRRRMQAFLLAGALAGLGGSLLAHSRPLITPTDFAATTSIDIVVLAVVGGISLVAGPLVGALLVVGLPNLAGLGAVAGVGLQVLFLVLVLFRPSGFLSFLVPVRDWWIEEWGRRRGIDPATIEHRSTPSRSPLATDSTLSKILTPVQQGTDPVLQVVEVSKSYGGVRAVREVSLEVSPGEAVAIIGPNGAGKTTLFENISGFVRPDHGQVLFLGQDITRRTPEYRASRGLVRSFQNALLFPTLTVRQTLALAASRAPERGVDPDAVMKAAGLEEFADSVMAKLPTGVRRVTELACNVCLSPKVLLLDEPSAGIAHSEIPSLAKWLRAMHDDLGVTLVVVDHDMNLLRAVCDRFVAMELGAVIAEGTADEVASDARVIEAFLGTNAAAVERSSAAVSA